MGRYTRFDPDLWKVVFNYEAIATVITESSTALNCAGHFRTTGDYIGLYFASEDKHQHTHCSYPTKLDYTGCSVSFSAEYGGSVCPFNDTTIVPALRVVNKANEYEEDSQYYVTMGFFGVKHSTSYSFTYDGAVHLPHSWIDMQSTSGHAVWNDPVIDEVTGEIVDYEPRSKDMVFGADYDMDFVTGRLFTTKEAGVPDYAQMTLDYTYNTHEKFVLNFDNLYEGTHPDFYRKVDPKEIYKVIMPIVPNGFTSGNLSMTGRSDTFNLKIVDINVVNGDLGEKKPPMPVHKYRVAEGFDDEYDKNPKRLAEVMASLGYRKIVNLYVGASHFYDKLGTAGVVSVGHTSMHLDPSKGLNIAFRQWLNSYIFHLKNNGVDEFVLSVSMENLQMPEDWKQLIHTGQAGGTGWNPPTNFYSPTNPDVRTYIRKVTKEMLDILVQNNFKPILQLGEPWWWFQEFQMGDINKPFEGQPPCFYDEYTKRRFKEDTGIDLKVYKRSDFFYVDKDDDLYTLKLNEYLAEYSNFKKSIAQEYEGSEYTVLFFPPSVLDRSRTPRVMQKVNTPFHVWDNNQLDFIQIEDYDWIVHDNPEHLDVYTFAWETLGYPFQKQHYFTGFAWDQFGVPLDEQWKLIEKAGAGALGRDFREVFVWAGTQIRRDSWNPRQNYYSSDSENWLAVNYPKN